MTNLTLEEQRMLTEFLGECWHEEKAFYVRKDIFFRTTAFGNEPHLSHRKKIYSGTEAECKQYVNYHKLQDYEIKSVKIKRLDFSDWRVVGRLIERIGKIETQVFVSGVWEARVNVDGIDVCSEAATPQLAICLAVLAYLRSK